MIDLNVTTAVDQGITLTDEQSKAFSKITKFLEHPTDKYFVLRGYAGTGKTTLITYLLQERHKYKLFGKRKIDACVGAPTNKAVKVLTQKMEIAGVKGSTGTIHSYLAIRPVINYKTGEEEFKPDKHRDKTILDFNLLILDESSMVNTNLFKILMDEIGLFPYKILFVGDPAQLPPVNEDESPTFQTERGVELTQVVRYGDKINGYAQQVRENINSADTPRIPMNWDKETGGIIPMRSMESYKKLVKSYFSSRNFEKDFDFARVLAWTNDKVNKWNKYIRDTILDHPTEQWTDRDRLIAVDACVDGLDDVILATSEEADVIGADIIQYQGHKTWSLKCRRENGKEIFLYAIHEDSVDALNRQLKMLASDKDWRAFYSLKKSFHNVNYCYALTIHKSQGSTFENVFLDANNAFKNKNIKERNQLLYVGITRASKSVFVL